MAERFDQLYGDLAEAEQHTKERLKGYYDRLAEEASMKSEKDSKLYDEVKEEIRNKDTDVYIDDQKVTKKVVDNVNKDTRKNGKCPIDM